MSVVILTPIHVKFIEDEVALWQVLQLFRHCFHIRILQIFYWHYVFLIVVISVVIE
jgi:hypothetical protein